MFYFVFCFAYSDVDYLNVSSIISITSDGEERAYCGTPSAFHITILLSEYGYHSLIR